MLALLVAAVCAMPLIGGAQQVDPGKMVQIFSESMRTQGGNLQVIILNDRTVEALFGTSPAKAAFRTKARMTGVLFVQGTASKEFDLKPEVTVIQKGETQQGKTTSMKNFTAGKVAKGAQIQGLVEFPKKIDLYEPFKVTIGNESVEFKLNADDVRNYGNP
ncbi:MAG: hypothetical protein EXQ55_00120 [Acidobacteria bacterium]|nr:hypothetical protein [Acidobacteriota bacterium]